MPTNRIQTQRLLLECLEPAHAELLFEGLSDRRLYEFIDDEPPESVLSLRSRYERLAVGKSQDGCESWLNWAIVISKDSQYAGFVQATINQDQSAQIAYVLFQESWGQGIAREAVTAMMNHIQENYRVRTFRATVDPRNRRSVALLELLGFRLERCRSGCVMLHGIPADEAEYVFEVEPE